MKRAAGFALAAAALAASSCGGDVLTIWKVSGIAGTRPPTCYKGGKITDTTQTTTTAQTYIGDWELYSASNGKFELHVGTVKEGAGGAQDTVYIGTSSGGAYTFDGLTNDLVFTGDPTAPTTIFLKKLASGLKESRGMSV